MVYFTSPITFAMQLIISCLLCDSVLKSIALQFLYKIQYSHVYINGCFVHLQKYLESHYNTTAVTGDHMGAWRSGC